MILDPDLRENLANSSDIPSSIHETVKEFEKLFPNFDTSLLELSNTNPELWFLMNTDEKQRKVLEAKIKAAT